MALDGAKAHLVAILSILSIAWVNGNVITDCPIGCFCDTKSVDSIPGGVGLKINCHPTASASGTFDIRLPSNTVQLDLSPKYGLERIKGNTFAGLVHLQKLDLQGNKIQLIESGAFRTVPKLEVLDLSRNRLSSLKKESLAGLVSLRRLKLTDNNLQTIYENSFDDLKSIEKVNGSDLDYHHSVLFFFFLQIDISDNPLVCNCQSRWLLDWIAVNAGRVANLPRVRCALPIALADKPLRDIEDSASVCTSDSIQHHTSFSQKVNLSPSNAQVVFEGDELSFHCQTEESNSYPSWLFNDNPISADSPSISITSAVGHSVLGIENLETAFKGRVTCRAAEDGGSASVDILVLPRNSAVCNPLEIDTSRGQYKWSAAIAGSTLRQWCQRRPSHQKVAEASMHCQPNGEWATFFNVSQCAYTNDVTDTLHKFATMNTSFTMNTLLESAKHFLNYTSDPRMFQNAMDVVYFSQAVENYLPYLPESNDVGHYMMDMVANILGASPPLLKEAQKRGLACRRLINVMENITAMAVPAFRHHYDTLAMETFFIKPMQLFDGISCAWYENSDYVPYSPRRVFHCVQSNKTVVSPDKKLLVSVTVPPSLYSQIDYLPYSSSSQVRLLFAAFDNASLFPTDWKVGQVVGCQLLGVKRNFNLSEPVRVSVSVDRRKTDEVITPVFWDQYDNGGFGAWNQSQCHLLSQSKTLVTFSCSQVGFYGLRYQFKDDLERSGALEASKWHSPVLYVGGGIALIFILLTSTIMAARWPILNMATELKHALINVWIDVLLLIYLYVMGIYQVNHSVTCLLVAFSLHQLMISSLFWILIGVYVIYCKVSRRKRSTNLLTRGGQEAFKTKAMEEETSAKRPLFRFYFFAYGAPLFIVAITASISLRNYQTDNFCFLTPLAPVIGALVVPCVLIFTVMIGFALSILCVLSASPYKVTETDRDFKKRLADSLDGNQSPKRLLLAFMLQAVLVVFGLAMAACQLYLPFYTTWSSVAVSIIAVAFGAYIFVTFCLLRCDVFRRSSNKSTACTISPDNEDITANLVELCPRPLPAPGATTNSSDRTSSLRPPVKDVNVVSSLFGPTNINIHPGITEMVPKTSSPANSHIPQVQDLTVSPLIAATDPTEPYSIVPLAYKPALPEMSLASVNTGLSYTDTSTIRMGVPCDMATFEMPTSASLVGTGTPKRLLNLRNNSSSLPRSLRHQHPMRKMPASQDDALETQSKFSAMSIGSSRSAHSRSGKKRHKKPTRRRSRQQQGENGKQAKEPLYNNLGEDEYMGDDDQFDTLERQRRTIALPDELPSIIHEVEGDEDLEEVEQDDMLSQGREEPASLDDLPPPNDQFDMPKRETSV